MHMRLDLLSGFQSSFEVSRHAGRDGEKVLIVAGISHDSGRSDGLLAAVILVCRDGLLVAGDGSRIVAGPQVNVGGHVDQVSGGRGEGLQAVRAGECALGVARCLHRMDIEMVHAGVEGPAAQRIFKHGDNFRRIGAYSIARGTGLTVDFPEMPRIQIHQAGGEERGCIRVVGIAMVDFAHRIGIVAGKLRLVRLGSVGEAEGQRIDMLRALRLPGHWARVPAAVWMASKPARSRSRLTVQAL